MSAASISAGASAAGDPELCGASMASAGGSAALADAIEAPPGSGSPAADAPADMEAVDTDIIP